ncbi:MAG: hypothetical protein JGK17_12350 [Microcoleus sp. PH2017_10_PVI_O_A]|nr:MULTISPECIES: hypothetical protein [unclassified Microcoleus]MCC3406356.1 hypothetical protein [Microcoleus sp. PH2017_10_PVI_O_A]MCC3478873.1 hypothetical protein [Microcoleus sp. PH2017_12_PCY_D_A]MCC3528485.1 hypothetical protein [Microcoleus sp. PH2017_21_RUC_O_A]
MTKSAGQKQSIKNTYKSFTFEQHKHLGQYIKQRRSEALNLSVISSWCYRRASKVGRLATNIDSVLSTLQFSLDNIVCGEVPANYILFKDGYKAELDPVKCYYGENELADKWQNELLAGFREEFHQQPSGGLYPPHNLSRRRNGFTLDEHRHVAKIMRCHIRQSAITTILIWNAYGTNSKATKAAYKWWKVAIALISELNKASGKIGIYDTTYPNDEANRFEVEIVADQSFAEPLIMPLQKALLQKAVVANVGKVTNDTYNLDLGLDWLKVNITYP